MKKDDLKNKVIFFIYMVYYKVGHYDYHNDQVFHDMEDNLIQYLLNIFLRVYMKYILYNVLLGQPILQFHIND